MNGSDEHRWVKIVAGYGLLVAGTIFVAAVVFHAVEPIHRSMVIRLAAGLLVGVALIHLASHRRRNLLPESPSDFERALARRPPPPKLDPAFIRWRDEVRSSLRDSRYFRQVMWPNLQNLARQRGLGAPEIERLLPAGRRFRRGPSLRQLARIVERLEHPW